MKLTRLKITNCSRIKDIDIEVRDNLVLIGPNGSGKSTVLLCMDLLMTTDEQQLHDSITEDFFRDSTKPFVVEGTFDALTGDERAAFAGDLDERNNGCTLRFRLQASVSGEKGSGGTEPPTSGEKGSDGTEPSTSERAVTIKRYFPKTGAAKQPTRAQCEAFGWTLLRDQESQHGEQGAKSIIDDVASEIDLGPNQEEASKILESVERLLARSSSPEDLLRHGANILAVDEPEAHLHPSSQRSLASLLKAGLGQKVMVTHSPTIAGSFAPDEIVVLHADGSVTQPKRGFLQGDGGMEARWWVGKQLEPLTASTVIAVEGPSDRVIVKKVAACLKLDLDLRDIVVVETGGCGDMRVVETIFGCGGFEIPLFELVDDDNRETIAQRVGADPEDAEDLAQHHVYVSQRDLEDEYVRAIGAPKLWAKLKESGAFSRYELRQCRLGPDGNPSARNLAAFARNKRNKIPTALVAVRLINEQNASQVGSVARLLKAVTCAAQ